MSLEIFNYKNSNPVSFLNSGSDDMNFEHNSQKDINLFANQK
jgi:hypothetical protein